MRRSTLYATMLALGVTVVFSLLRLGSGLQAPPAIGGEWQLRIDGPAASRCARWRGAAPPTLTIEQTGPEVDLLLTGGTELKGRIDDNTLRAQGHDPCALALSAAFDGRSPHSMRGRVDVAGSGSFPFTATRAERERKR